MNDQPFGTQNNKKGAKVLSNAEWNQLNSAFQNTDISQEYLTPDIDPYTGLNVPLDSFTYPHLASVSGDYQHALIGENREEEYYPFVDYVQLTRRAYVFSFKNIGGDFDGVFTFSKFNATTVTNNVRFPTMNSVVPAKPADPNNGIIVGYKWTLEPTCVSGENDFEGDIGVASISWYARGDFDVGLSEGTAEIYSEEYDPNDIDSWSITNETGSTEYSIKTLIEEAYGNTFTIYDATLGTVNEKIIKIPVARYDWEGDQLVRCVQLYFGGAGAGVDGETIPITDFRHPFKGYVSGDISEGFKIAIAPDRTNNTYEFKDIITVQDNRDHKAISIPKTIGEYVDITEDSYVYYDIQHNGTNWVAPLSASPIWPPSDDPDHIYKVVGYANLSGTACYWGQEMFECPIEDPAELRGDFYPTYEDGNVYIGDGYVRTWEADTRYQINGTTMALVTPADAWVEIYSIDSQDALPDIRLNYDVQTGTFPGKYNESGVSATFAYQLGEVTSDGIYLPYHIGSLDIDNTMLQIEVGEQFRTDQHSMRKLLLGDAQTGINNVGWTSNDLLLSGAIIDEHIRGGSINKIVQDSELKFRGLTQDSSQETVGWTVAAGEVALSGYPVSGVFERGLAQQLTQGVPASKLRLLEGTYIELAATDANTSTINVDTSTWTTVTVVTDVQLLSGGTLQKKTRTVLTPTAGTESGWTAAGSLSTIGCAD